MGTSTSAPEEMSEDEMSRFQMEYKTAKPLAGVRAVRGWIPVQCQPAGTDARRFWGAAATSILPNTRIQTSPKKGIVWVLANLCTGERRRFGVLESRGARRWCLRVSEHVQAVRTQCACQVLLWPK